jgi:hypothetical protein
MSKTRHETQLKVLFILTGGDVGTNPSEEDTATIDGYIDAVVAELAADLIYISDPDQLEDEIFLTFCKLVAQAAAEEYVGKSDERASLALRNRMRQLKRPMPGYGPQDVVYY